jgi:DNA-binding response OmpR family regulator
LIEALGMVATKVVVVDDDRDIQEALRDALEAEGFQVHVVPNGLKLVRALRVVRPDVILLDVMMSWINGLDLCVALKQNPEYRDIPVIFISARTSASDVRRGYEVGAADYVTKPFDLDDLLARMRRVIATSPAPSHQL